MQKYVILKLKLSNVVKFALILILFNHENTQNMQKYVILKVKLSNVVKFAHILILFIYLFFWGGGGRGKLCSYYIPTWIEKKDNGPHPGCDN